MSWETPVRQFQRMWAWTAFIRGDPLNIDHYLKTGEKAHYMIINDRYKWVNWGNAR